MGNQESSCCSCCRRIRARFYRLEGEVLASDPPDFGDGRYWLAHPQHHPRRVDECLPKIAYIIQADGSMQQEELNESDPQTLDAPADVFYLHGTMEGFGNRASINRYDQEAWVGFNTRHQMTACTAFTSACRAFAPLYRQAGMGGSWDLAFQDILSAFEHFLSETGERPFVLAGHSQGSIHIQRLVSERIAPDAAVMKRLVAVHAPGMGHWIEPSPLPLDTGSATAGPTVAIWAAATPQADRKWTLIGFMSGGKGFADFANPAGWSLTSSGGSPRGALLPEDDSRLPVLFRNFVERAEVTDGLLRVHHNPAIQDKMQKLHNGHQDLHPYDIHLFWADVREHVKQQVASFLSK